MFDFLTNPWEDMCFLNYLSFIFTARLFWNREEPGLAENLGGDCDCPINYIINKMSSAEFLSIIIKV